jgi:glutaredoxin 3
VYSKSYCPFATQTKKLLQSKGVAATIIELDNVPNGTAIHNALKVVSGQNTVPNTYIAGEHIGGNSEIQGLASSGALKKKLDAAGISNNF